MRRAQVVEAPEHLPVAAIGAARIMSSRPLERRGLPAVALLAAPPHPGSAAEDHLAGMEVPVAVPIPLPGDSGESALQVVEAPEDPVTRAVRAARAGERARRDARIPLMSAFPEPPDDLRRVLLDGARRQVAVLRRMPLARQLGVAGGQVVEPLEQLPPGAIGAAAVDPRRPRRHRLLPFMAAFPQPPELPSRMGAYLLRREVPVPGGMELPGDIPPRLCEVVFPDDEVPSPSLPLAGGALPAELGGVPQVLLPFEPAVRAEPPDALARPVGDRARVEAPVLGRMPEPQKRCAQAFYAVEIGEDLAPGAVRAPAVVERPAPHGDLPAVTARGLPPDALLARTRDVGRTELAVLLAIPFGEEVLVPEPQAPLLEADEQARPLEEADPLDARLPHRDGIRHGNGTERGIPLSRIVDQRFEGGKDVQPAVLLEPSARADAADMAQGAVPEIHLGAAADAHFVRGEVPVLHGMPERGEVGADRCDVVEAREHLPSRAIGAQRPLPAPNSLGDRRAPFVTAVAEPPDLLLEIGEHIARPQTAVPRRMPLCGEVRPQRRKVVFACDELHVRAGEAVVEAPARPARGGFPPRISAFGASPPHPLLRPAHVVVGRLSAVALVIPLLDDPHAPVPLAPLVERPEPLGAQARQSLEGLRPILSANVARYALAAPSALDRVDVDPLPADPRFDDLAREALGHGVVVPPDRHDAIGCRAHPLRRAGREAVRRKLLHAMQFLGKIDLPAALPSESRHAAIVVDVDQAAHRLVELVDAGELHLRKRPDDPVGHDANMALHRRLVPGRPHPRWKNVAAVVPRQFRVGGPDAAVAPLEHHPRGEVVRREPQRRTAEELEHRDVMLEPGLRPHIEARANEGVVAVRGSGHEEAHRHRRPVLSGEGELPPRPIDLDLLPGRPVDVHLGNAAPAGKPLREPPSEGGFRIGLLPRGFGQAAVEAVRLAQIGLAAGKLGQDPFVVASEAARRLARVDKARELAVGQLHRDGPPDADALGVRDHLGGLGDAAAAEESHLGEAEADRPQLDHLPALPPVHDAAPEPIASRTASMQRGPPDATTFAHASSKLVSDGASLSSSSCLQRLYPERSRLQASSSSPMTSAVLRPESSAGGIKRARILLANQRCRGGLWESSVTVRLAPGSAGRSWSATNLPSK